MLDFKLEENSIIYKKKVNILILNSNDSVTYLCPEEKKDEIISNIREYFDNNDFARMLIGLSPKEANNATIKEMHLLLKTMLKHYIKIKNNFDLYPGAKGRIFAVRYNLNNSDYENAKMFYVGLTVNSNIEAEQLLPMVAGDWCLHYDYEAIVLKEEKDFLKKIIQG